MTGPQRGRGRPPSVDAVLRTDAVLHAMPRYGRLPLTEAVRAVLADVRAASLPEDAAEFGPEIIGERAVARAAAAARPSQRPVFNLTGTVLHTNLGRAILAEAAQAAAFTAMSEATNAEYDIAEGRRGERDDHVRGLLIELTGAEDALAVNNNAAAVILCLNTLANRKEAVVSRGELVEIGGAFRMPDVMERAGAKLREVGTTNRTHPADYANAIGKRTALLMKVHTSNYRIEGFTAQTSHRDVAAIAREHGLAFIDDLGSGALADLTAFGLPAERTVAAALADGADLVTFSGDKLLGGPQAGLIVGRRDLVRRLARNPLKRALRLDRMRLAALEATLRLYRDPDTLAQRLPTLRLLTRQPAELHAIAERIVGPLAAALGEGWSVAVIDCTSETGSGALPLATLPSIGLGIAPRQARASGRALDGLAARFRALPKPVIGRIADGRLVFDLRCLEDVDAFLAQLNAAGHALRSGVA